MYISYTSEINDELNILARFNLDTTQEGIKIHSSAAPNVIAATKRLHEKSLVTQPDGGYLTELGRHAAEHAQQLLTIVKA